MAPGDQPRDHGGTTPTTSWKAIARREVAKRIMDRTCKGRPYNQAIDGMRGINYYTVFTCRVTITASLTARSCGEVALVIRDGGVIRATRARVRLMTPAAQP